MKDDNQNQNSVGMERCHLTSGMERNFFKVILSHWMARKASSYLFHWIDTFSFDVTNSVDVQKANI